MTIKYITYIEERIKTYNESKSLFEAIGLNETLVNHFISTSLLATWDLYYMWEYAKNLPDGSNYLELGAYCGGSLILMSEAAKQAGKHFHLSTIDITVWPPFTENCKDIKHTFHLCHTDEAKDRIEDNSIDLLFIDGDHKYPQAKIDFINYFRKLKIGGIFIGHDYPCVTVARSAIEVFGKDIILPPKSAIFVVKKEKELE